MSGVAIDRRAVQTGLVLSAISAALATAALVVAGSGTGLAATAAGGALLVGAGVADVRGLLDLGALVMFAGVVLAGVGGALPGPLLVAMVGTVVAWDAADHAVSLGEQLGREARTSQAVAAHVGATTAVGAAGAAVSYTVYRLVGGGKPASAVVILLLAALLMTRALRQ